MSWTHREACQEYLLNRKDMKDIPFRWDPTRKKKLYHEDDLMKTSLQKYGDWDGFIEAKKKKREEKKFIQESQRQQQRIQERAEEAKQDQRRFYLETELSREGLSFEDAKGHTKFHRYFQATCKDYIYRNTPSDPARVVNWILIEKEQYTPEELRGDELIYCLKQHYLWPPTEGVMWKSIIEGKLKHLTIEQAVQLYRERHFFYRESNFLSYLNEERAQKKQRKWLPGLHREKLDALWLSEDPVDQQQIKRCQRKAYVQYRQETSIEHLPEEMVTRLEPIYQLSIENPVEYQKLLEN